jgi:uncharacterized protein YqcC (DUF446 family)
MEWSEASKTHGERLSQSSGRNETHVDRLTKCTVGLLQVSDRNKTQAEYSKPDKTNGERPFSVKTTQPHWMQWCWHNPRWQAF